MVKQKSKTDRLNKRELWLLGLLPEDAFRFKCLISSATLDSWCRLGLPYHLFAGKRYFDNDEVHSWLEAPCEDEVGRNLDYIWERTPEDELPRAEYTFPNGWRYLLVPVEKRASRRQRKRKKSNKSKN